MESRKQFTFYRSYFEAIQDLGKNDKTAVLLAVCSYALYGTEPNLSGAASAVFKVIRPTLDAGRRKAMGGSAGRSMKDTDKISASSGKDTDKISASSGKDTDKISASSGKDADNKKEKEKEGEIEKEIENECYTPYPLSAQKEQDAAKMGERDANKFSNSLRLLWNSYPANRREPFAACLLAAERAEMTEDDVNQAAANLVYWKKSLDWTRDNGRYIPGIAKWIESGKWISPPPAAQMTSNPFLAQILEGEMRGQG